MNLNQTLRAIGCRNGARAHFPLLSWLNPHSKKVRLTWLANAKKEGVHTTASGLQYKVLTEGTGKSPKATDTVLVHYRGTLLGRHGIRQFVFARNQPISFPLNRVIAGWTEGVQLMKEGAKYQFVIPAKLAYGSSGTPGGPIGPDETLIFDVELLKVR